MENISKSVGASFIILVLLFFKVCALFLKTQLEFVLSWFFGTSFGKQQGKCKTTDSTSAI